MKIKALPIKICGKWLTQYLENYSTKTLYYERQNISNQGLILPQEIFLKMRLTQRIMEENNEEQLSIEQNTKN